MENVIVIFPESRSVLVDGEVTGETNSILRVNEGTHTFKLSDPQDYKPKWRRVLVSQTNPNNPKEVTFEKA